MSRTLTAALASLVLAGAVGCGPAPDYKPRGYGSMKIDLTFHSAHLAQTAVEVRWVWRRQDGSNGPGDAVQIMAGSMPADGKWSTVIPHLAGWYAFHLSVVPLQDAKGKTHDDTQKTCRVEIVHTDAEPDKSTASNVEAGKVVQCDLGDIDYDK